ncbi:Nuclear pore complex protein 155 [Blattella germanica]|nr:Nuclear pore complex protein 155 [Blattella germanica]
MNTTIIDRMPTVDSMRTQVDLLDTAGKMLEKYLAMDSSFPSLVDVTQIASQGCATVSGLNDMDYPTMNGLVTGQSTLKHVTTTNKVPLPPEVMEHFGRPLGPLEEMHLLPDPVFVLPTDGVTINTIASTATGRIFLGGRDGCLYEVAYQGACSWFGKRCKKLNHSTGTLSFLVPSFLNMAFSEEDPISQISVDNSRNILYTLTEKGRIEVFDLGDTGTSTSKVTSMTQATIVQIAVHIVK